MYLKEGNGIRKPSTTINVEELYHVEQVTRDGKKVYQIDYHFLMKYQIKARSEGIKWERDRILRICRMMGFHGQRVATRIMDDGMGD